MSNERLAVSLALTKEALLHNISTIRVSTWINPPPWEAFDPIRGARETREAGDMECGD